MKKYDNWSVRNKLLIPLVIMIGLGAAITALAFSSTAKRIRNDSIPRQAAISNLESNTLGLAAEYQEFLVRSEPSVLIEIREFVEDLEADILSFQAADDTAHQARHRDDVKTLRSGLTSMLRHGDNLVITHREILSKLVELETLENGDRDMLGQVRASLLQRASPAQIAEDPDNQYVLSIPEFAEIGGMDNGALRILSETREFVLAANPVTREELKESYASIMEHLDRFAALAKDEPDTSIFVDDLDESQRKLIALSMALVTDALKRAEIAENLATSRGVLHEKISAVADHLSQDMVVELARQQVIILGTMIAVLAVSILVVLLVSGRITGALFRLGEAARGLAAGNIESRAEIESSDELGMLAKTFNSMADDLHKAVLDRERVEQALRQAQKMEAVGQLAGGIAHDFNNSLAVALGNLELLSEYDNLNDKASNAALRLQKSLEKSSELTQRLLAFSRRQVLSPRTINPGDFVTEMVELMERTLGDDIEVEFEKGPNLWSIKVDPGHLESSLLNLSLNARDAMPGGGRLTVRLYNRVVTSPAEENIDLLPGDFVLLEVEDGGTGIPPENLHRVLEPFFTTKGQGSGLGLSMVYGFVKQSGGDIAMESQVENGTRVLLYLPRADHQPEKRDDIAALSQTYAKQNEVILIVEDEPEVRDMISTIVEKLGYRAAVACDAEDALEVVAKMPDIDLILSDIKLGKGKTGYEMAQELINTHPQIPILFMSGFADDAPQELGKSRFGFHFLAKPFRSEKLARNIRRMLRERRRYEAQSPGAS